MDLQGASRGGGTLLMKSRTYRRDWIGKINSEPSIMDHLGTLSTCEKTNTRLMPKTHSDSDVEEKTKTFEEEVHRWNDYIRQLSISGHHHCNRRHWLLHVTAIFFPVCGRETLYWRAVQTANNAMLCAISSHCYAGTVHKYTLTSIDPRT